MIKTQRRNILQTNRIRYCSIVTFEAYDHIRKGYVILVYEKKTQWFSKLYLTERKRMSSRNQFFSI